MLDVFKNQKVMLVLAGAAGTIVGEKILKSSKTRELAVKGIAKGMMLCDDAREEITNMKEEAEDICHEARMKAREERNGAPEEEPEEKQTEQEA